ncbi:hypothetical protein CsSME_00015254 [Camellia sinensis var. sinensis]
MGSVCRSAIMGGVRSLTTRFETLSSPKPMPSFSSSFSSSTRTIPCHGLRVVSVLESIDSMMPLRSVIVFARLKSSITLDSTSWSCLSQKKTPPLSFFLLL